MDFTLELFGQILSILAMVITVLSFQFKTRGQILIAQTIGSVLFLVSYVFLHSWSAVAINVIYLVRNMVYYFKDKCKFINGIWTLIFFCMACVISTIFTYTNWIDVLPLIGAIFGCIALYMTKPNLMRKIKIGDSVSWLLYNSITFVIGGIICESFNLISIVLAVIREKKFENSK